MLIVDNFSKYGWTVPLKNKNAQTVNDSFEKIISQAQKENQIYSKRIVVRNFLTIFFKHNNNIKHYARNTSLGAVFAERFNRTIRDLRKRPVFEKGDSNLIDVLPTITKQFNNRVPTSTQLTPTQASLKRMKDMFTIIY